MKRNILHSFLFIALIMLSMSIQAQTLKPVVQFEDEPRTHNAHLASDGQHLYTINCGKAHLGQISKFSFTGEFITSYDIDLDMRSLMWHPKEKQFYVCTYERNI